MAAYVDWFKTERGKSTAGWLAALAIAFLFGCQHIYEPDTYWNLAGGRLILQGHFPTVNTFAHTYPDHPWEFTSWLFGAYLAAIHTIFGDPGMTLAAIVTSVSFAALLTAAARRMDPALRWRIFLPVLALGVIAIQYRFQPRGDNATMLGLAAIPILWMSRTRKTPLWAFLLAVAWSNMHSGVVYGLCAWAVYAAASLAKGDKRAVKEAALAGLAFFAGSLLNPTATYSYFWGVAGDYSFFAGMVSELQRVSPERFPSIFLFWLIGSAACVEGLIRRDYAFVALFSGFSLASFLGARFAVYPVAVALPGVAVYCGHLFGRLTKSKVRAAVALVLVAAGCSCAYFDIRHNVRMENYGFGAGPRHFPVAASEFIEQAGISGDFFNEFNFGGYLAGRFYPERRVYLDGRMLAYPKEFYVRTLERPDQSLLGQMEEFPDAHVAMVMRRDQGSEYEQAFDALGWKQVYLDRTTDVFVRPGTPAERAGEKYQLQIIKLWLSDAELFQNVLFNRGQALAELKTLKLRGFSRAYDFYRLANSALIAGDPALAEEFYLRGLRWNPDHPKLTEEYGKFRGGVGK